MRIRAILLTCLALVLAATAIQAQSGHVMTTPGAVKWGPAPPALPAGAQLAVMDGDPSKPGLFTIRLKFPDGYRIPPHWHPTDEHLVILQGLFRMGVGDKADAAAAHDMAVGSYGKMPAKTRHYAFAKGDTIVQIHGEGPFVLNYVNATDDPTKKK
jgi:quercetin dioxygenase-like cupin family protein